MEVSASKKNIRMSPQKMREVVRQIQGLPALQAQATLAVVPRKGARYVAETLAAAIANAEHIRTAWKPNELQQKISDLQGLLNNTRNHKRRNRYNFEIERYQSFLDSEHRLEPESLRIKEAVTGSSVIMRRFTPKARGSAGPILKRHCHIRIVLSDE
jgi:large subunit ribosomal protein L22